MSSAKLALQNAVLLRSALAQAAQTGESIMGQVLALARQTLNERATQTRSTRDREELALGLKLLADHATVLCDRYPAALAAEFAQTDALAVGSVRALSDLHFDQLELMDSEQVEGSVALAKAQQVTLLAVDAAFAEFNRFMATLLDLSTVAPERNPLRPDVFVQVLQSLLVQTQAPLAVIPMALWS